MTAVNQDKDFANKIIAKFTDILFEKQYMSAWGVMHDEIGDDDAVCHLVGNWNEPKANIIAQGMVAIFDRLSDGSANSWDYFVFDFDDEYMTCSDCGNLIKTSPDGYDWTADFWHSEGGIQCATCAESDQYEGFIGHIKNNPKRANTLISDLSDYGYTQIEAEYQAGWYGTNDNPETILKRLQAKSPDCDFIFGIDNVGQYHCDFAVWYSGEFNELKD